MTGKKSCKGKFAGGSALILAVVLVSLLAIVGVMFVMAARVDEMATSAISENKELNLAVESVIARISQELVLDVPGAADAEYYDYPGGNDKWLSNLEPYQGTTGYEWRQISDVTGYIERNWGLVAQEDVRAETVEDHEAIILDSDGEIQEPGGQLADADGDGVSDSKWIELETAENEPIVTQKGKPVFAAVRIIDNGAMLNVNTAYEFDPNGEIDPTKIDGSCLTQIDLLALSERGGGNTAEDLDDERYGSELHNLNNYIEDVVWRYNDPNGGYTPFDMADELELRNRFLLEFEHINTRIEIDLWDDVFTGGDYLHVPVGSSTGSTLSDWFDKIQYDLSEPNAYEEYSYRHIATTYNMDRIIDPNGQRMLNVNRATADSLREVIGTALGDTNDPNFTDVNETAAQVAANIVDFRDNDSDVTAVYDDSGGPHYGFERPCIYISELAHNFVEPNISPVPLSFFYHSYAVELYKPYEEDVYPELNRWRLQISGPFSSPINVDINWSGTKRFHVLRWEDPEAELDVDFDANDLDPNFVSTIQEPVDGPNNIVFASGSVVQLLRFIPDTNDYIVVDSVQVPDKEGDWLARDDVGPQSVERDITRHKCIRDLWADADQADSPTLGGINDYVDPNTRMIQAHPANREFTNVGEIARVFSENAYVIGASDTEADVRFDLTDPGYQQIFKYITRFDPTEDGIDNDGDGIGQAGIDSDELKVPGRININTAPWYVMAQLPWMEPGIARAIVAYRDKTTIADQNSIDYSDREGEDATGLDRLREEEGFASIGELAAVINDSNDPGADDYSMYYYTLSGETGDLTRFPDLTRTDGAPDDFEERDVIFARISDLVTVRSDVFTAYILVRIGPDGPQKRVIAILDRSDVYFGDGRVRVRALHPVADPR